jgi:hypothetical protein
MEPDLLIKIFPRLYHMAEHDAWPSIRKHGLLSTTALLDLFGVSGMARVALESAHRPESVTIHDPEHGKAVIRNQKPMDDKGLLRCLKDATPKDWYRILNLKTFFWLDEARLKTLLNARAYRKKAHCVLTVDTRKLVEQYIDRINLSPMNSGCTKPMPHPRSKQTFLPIRDYPFDSWLNKRRDARRSVVELSVDYSVPNIADLTIRAEILDGNGRAELLFDRG